MDKELQLRLRKIIGANVTALKAARKLTQAQIGGKAGINQTTVGRIERAKHPTTVDTLAGLAAALQVEPWQLLVPSLDPKSLPETATPAERAHWTELRKVVASVGLFEEKETEPK